MSNPFEKRATEYLKDSSAFLSIVTPEPLDTFFSNPAKDDSLFDRLSVVIGTPGSGKTTIATLMQYNTVYTLINSPNHTEYGVLLDALKKCKIVGAENNIDVIGCRIPMESEYRDFWELPYSEEIKHGLLKSFLQSRAIIQWLNYLQQDESLDFKKIKFLYRDQATVASETLGGSLAEEILERAKKVERVIYQVSASLIPPKIDDIPKLALEPYQLFDSILNIEVSNRDGKKSKLRPLVILDDVHTLHPDQIFSLRDWLARREMKISRWMMMRLDAQTPESILHSELTSHSSIGMDTTIQESREISQIWLQSGEDRLSKRNNFRVMAKNMADKYLRLMPIFQRNGLSSIQDILNSKPSELTKSNLEKLKSSVSRLQDKNNISPTVIDDFNSQIETYFNGGSNVKGGEDVKLATLKILLNRYIKRVPQASLFEDQLTAEPSKPIKLNSGIVDGAKIHLLHEFKRPYYFGIDDLCDGSSENAEQFLLLASQLVSASETKIIRGDRAELRADFQHKLLRKKAEEIISKWAFPKHSEVIRICNLISDQCIKKSLEPNASLEGGPNAIGIPDEDFKKILNKKHDLAQALKYGVAYNALTIKRKHSTKNRFWTLIELSGVYKIKSGLTFKRGGFLERDLEHLMSIYKD
ncbi:ORC-CDC6 family AAA ATPase [Neptuniibacter pectenicola]|uniref:ORC-CDC6 family AAA ATPase n=1 Tax=Neptuniibacter pectenicola TaxID=1806669 RepID=UPI0008335EAF|nr:hypothetical protein [Neptuniibacter pectenicola]